MNEFIKPPLKIISIDVANKSLAIACLEIYKYNTDLFMVDANNADIMNSTITSNTSNANNANNTHNSTERLVHRINAFMKFIKSRPNINIHKLEVIDLLPNQKTIHVGLTHRTDKLYTFITKFCDKLTASNWITSNMQVLIEYQMGPNKKTNDIQAQLIFHFLKYVSVENIKLVGPSLKNTLYYINDPKSHHSFYIQKYRNLYTANKAHTRYLFVKWIQSTNQNKLLKHINKRNYSDIADAFCQAVAWAK